MQRGKGAREDQVHDQAHHQGQQRAGQADRGEPHHLVGDAEQRWQADVQDMHDPESVERLAGEPADQADQHQGLYDRGAGGPAPSRPGTARPPWPTSSIRRPHRREPGSGIERQHGCQYDEAGAADDDRQPDPEQAERTASTMPAMVPAIRSWMADEHRRDVLGSDLIGIQACCAPLVKLYLTPHSTWPASTAANEGTAHSASPAPTSTRPIRTESRRLYTSATIPVGTSPTNTDASSTVPTRTSCNGLSPDHLDLVDQVQREGQRVARGRHAGQPQVHRNRWPPVLMSGEDGAYRSRCHATSAVDESSAAGTGAISAAVPAGASGWCARRLQLALGLRRARSAHAAARTRPC